MSYFGAISVGTWFSTFNSWHIYRKINNNFAISTNGEYVAFCDTDKVYVIK